MLIFLKLGGSLITDKRQTETVRRDVIERLVNEIAQARQANPELSLVIGHGSGSFGHVPAKQYGTRDGVHTPEQWQGFALTADAAARLTRILVEQFLKVGIPIWSLQPSAMLCCEDGQILDGPAHTIIGALRRGLVPLIHGDVALDDVRGGTIVSTEEIFEWLVEQLPADLQLQRLILAGEVDGVYTADPQRDPAARAIAEITPETLQSVQAGLSGSHGVDVTGGMVAKVNLAFDMIAKMPGLEVLLCSGLGLGNIQSALTYTNNSKRQSIGTLIHS